MRILVCFKITRDLDAFTADEWSRMNEHRHDLSLAPRILGLYDEGALEHARRWKESLLAAGEPVTLEGLTVGAGHYDTICSNLFAIGYDRLYCLDTKEESLIPPPSCTASLLASFIRSQEPYDLIFCGMQTTPLDSGLVPGMLGSALSLPVIGPLTDLRAADDLSPEADLEIPGEHTTVRIAPPAVLVFGNALHPYLKIATLKEKLSVRDKRLLVLPAPEEISLDSASFVSVHSAFPEKQCRFPVQGKSIAQAAGLLRDMLLQPPQEQPVGAPHRLHPQGAATTSVSSSGEKPQSFPDTLRMVWLLPQTSPSFREQAAALYAVSRSMNHSLSPENISLWIASEPEYDLPAGLPVSVCRYARGISRRDLLPEQTVHFAASLLAAEPPDLILLPDGARERQIAARLASLFCTGVVSNVSALCSDGEDSWIAEYTCFSQNLRVKTKVKGRPLIVVCASSASTPLPPSGTEENTHTPIPCVVTGESVPPLSAAPSYRVICSREAETAGGLRNANTVLIGGRGLDGRENLEKMILLAGQSDAEWGTTRALYADGLSGHERVVGISGTTVSPETAVLFGVSGAAAFVSGLQQAKTVISVNSDPHARIFRYSDIGIVADCGELLDALNTVPV